MRYLSVCSGIEAATVAWHPLGWSPVAFAEIEKFPSAVLAHHYPHVPNLGDMTKFKDWPDADVNVLVGGTPCQSFSVAGLRKGMADPRGNLALTYLAIAGRYRPEWLLWENVPGVLSSSGGRDFGAFLGGLAELGYGFAYRVLDASVVRVDGFGRAVPQRRRRVFVVGNSRDWRRAAAVLFERESLSWDSAPRREAGERVAPTISSRPTGGGGLGTDFDCDGGLISRGPCAKQTVRSTIVAVSGQRYIGENDCDNPQTVCPRADMPTGVGYNLCTAVCRQTAHSEVNALRAAGNDARGAILYLEGHTYACDPCKAACAAAGIREIVVGPPPNELIASTGNVAHCLNAGAMGRIDYETETMIAHALRGEGFDAGEDGTGRGTPLVPVHAIQAGALRENPESGPDGVGVQADLAYTLEARAEVQAIAFDCKASGLSAVQKIRRSTRRQNEPAPTSWAVRRLVPEECEFLQGFPRGYTDIPWRGKGNAPDGPRYKALGNSMAVNVMRWIGRRIQMVQEIGAHQ